MAGPAGKKGYAENTHTPKFVKDQRAVANKKSRAADQSKSLTSFRAGERASAAKSPQAHKAGPTTGKQKAPGLTAPRGKGATVGDAAKAVTDAAWGVNRGIQGALSSSPGLKAPQIKGVMKLKPKRK